ncbi:MAG: alpha/beta fold hydrolase [Chitinophagaceae bacterium]|nr:MAG: alpha/beta fold hydrolase [Chitinophagaceae bacterium]
MRTFFVCTIALLSGCLLYNPCHAQEPDTLLAEKFMDLNNTGRFSEAKEMFAASIRPQLPPDVLKKTWELLNKKYGKYRGIESMEVIRVDTFRHVRTICDFEKAEITFSFAFNPSHWLYGFVIVGVSEKDSKPAVSGLLPHTISIDTSVRVNGGKIYGTLLAPKNKKTYPVVLIIAGSGPTDRNGNSTLGETSNMYLMLADSLAAHGIASFRYDKRYLGKSVDFLPSAIEHISFDDYVDDAADIVNFLKNDPAFSQVIIAGHSEGSLIGMIAAQKTKVNAYISLAGAGENFGKILEWQLDQQEGINKDTVKNILNTIREGKIATDIPSYLQMLFLPYLQHYMFTEMRYDPSEEIKKLSVPVLIVNGTTDIQVNMKQAELLHRAKPDAALSIIPGMNHILKDAPEERSENIATYNNPDLPLNGTLIKEIVQFINSIPSHSHS